MSDGVRVGRPRLEPDGHALETLSADGTPQTAEVSGSYGQRFSTLSSGIWPIDGFHGSDPDGGLSHMGARHMRLGDGLWLQPEPLLYLGMTNGEIDKPLFYGRVYAAGRPWGLEDRSGRNPIAIGAGGGAAVGGAVALGAAVVVAGMALSDAYDAYQTAHPSPLGGPTQAPRNAPVTVQGDATATGVVASQEGGRQTAGEGSAGRRFIVDPRGNTLIEPEGGETVGNPTGEWVETRYPNGSPAQQLHGPHAGHPEPHGHGFEPGAGRNQRGQSLDTEGNPVAESAPEAHWEVKQ